MANYTNMVKSNHDRSEAMLNLSLTTISEMVEDGEKVTVAELVRRTGFSRDYFYKNKDVYGRRYHTYLIDGMEFFGQKDIANYLGINLIQFQNYMYHNGISIERAYYHFKTKRLQEEKKDESKEYQH